MHFGKPVICLIPALALLGACAQATNETRGTVLVDGVSYTTVTRQYEQNGQTVTTGGVIYSNRTYGCNTSLQGDCEETVQRLRNSSDSGRLVAGMDSSSFIIPGVN